jgi:energy-coupling factor transporter ATP-binding protein EcfA2
MASVRRKVTVALTTLVVENFAQIRKAEIKFGDLTVLVGPQGTGKSLILQWLKAALDGREIVTALKAAGQHAQGAELIDFIFGQGMGVSWTRHSRVVFDGKRLSPETLSLRGNKDASAQAFFIPAHRSTLLADGWAAPFQRLPPDVPVAARMFSQNLFERFSAKGGDDLFPVDKLLKREVRDLIDDAVFHRGKVSLEQQAAGAKRLKLSHGKAVLPFMTWTAGQREFTPLLLGLYHLLPRTKKRKHAHVKWAIVEEPEMGLHPRAINVFMLLVLDLLWRGYRVVLSTHSPDVLTAIWMLQRMKEANAGPGDILQAFDAPTTSAPLRSVALSALEKIYRVYSLAFVDKDRVVSKDISALNPDADDASEADWGGLTQFSTNYGEALSRVINRNERAKLRLAA